MRRRQLSDEVASHVRQAIMSGALAPGSSVRAEALGEELEVSATPVREALHALRVEGFLELVPRKGFTVAPLGADHIRDIFEAHALIAGELAARAAERADEATVDELRSVHRELMDSVTAGEREVLERKNHEFHAAVYLAARSERLSWALGNFVRYVPRAFFTQIEGWAESTAHAHTEVLEAIIGRAPDAARAAMGAHIRKSGEQLAEYFESRPQPESHESA